VKCVGDAGLRSRWQHGSCDYVNPVCWSLRRSHSRENNATRLDTIAVCFWHILFYWKDGRCGKERISLVVMRTHCLSARIITKFMNSRWHHKPFLQQPCPINSNYIEHSIGDACALCNCHRLSRESIWPKREDGDINENFWIFRMRRSTPSLL